MKNEFHTTSPEKIELYETTYPLVKALYDEITQLSKKKPDTTINDSKCKIINRLLHDARLVLVDEESYKYLDMLDNETLPQYSDVVIILSQYIAALRAFRSKYGFSFN